MSSRRATSGLSSSLYADFLAAHSQLTDYLEPRAHARHAVAINAIAPNGTALGVETSFFKAAVKQRIESALVCESHVNSVITSSVRVTSSRHLAIQAHLQASTHLRFTLEAQESASDKAPVASFARIGVDYKANRVFGGATIDAVNGPTLQATMGGRIGSSVAFGILGAYDVGLDHPSHDRRGRFTTLDVATSYTLEDLHALLQMNDGGRMVRLELTQTMSPKVTLSSTFVLDRKKDKRVLRLLGKYVVSETDALSSSIGSDGIFIGAFEWRASKNLKTRVSTQMDLRHFDSDSHHLGVSIEIS